MACEKNTFTWGNGGPSAVADVVRETQARFRLFRAPGAPDLPNLATAGNILDLLDWCEEQTPNRSYFDGEPTALFQWDRWSDRRYQYKAATLEAIEAGGKSTHNAADLHQRVTGPLLLGICEGACDVKGLPKGGRFPPDFVTPLVLGNQRDALASHHADAVAKLLGSVVPGSGSNWDPRCWPWWAQATAGAFASAVVIRFLFVR